MSYLVICLDPQDENVSDIDHTDTATQQGTSFAEVAAQPAASPPLDTTINRDQTLQALHSGLQSQTLPSKSLPHKILGSDKLSVPLVASGQRSDQVVNEDTRIVMSQVW